MSPDPDADDVRRVLGGESSAFEGIVQRWQRPLVNLAWRCCRHRELAEDLAQEVFLKVFRALDRWRGESSFSTWIFAVAINHVRSRLRRKPAELLGIEAAQGIADPRSEPPRTDANAPAEALRRAVAGLPPRYREPIVLYYFGQHDVAECARILGIPSGTMKARLTRARALLARTFRVSPPGGSDRHEGEHG